MLKCKVPLWLKRFEWFMNKLPWPNRRKIYDVTTGHFIITAATRGTFRATSHLCVKRERPLIITYSLYSGNIINYHFYVQHAGGGAEAEKLALSQL